MRLVVVVEGQTEEAFVNDLLVSHLADRGVFASATIVGKMVAEKRGHHVRGGGSFRHWLADIRRILGKGADDGVRVTTLFDLYGLPEDFPRLRELASEQNTNRRCEALETALAATVGDRRFLPYLQRHEFEALVFASLPALGTLLDAEDDLDGLEALDRQIGRCRAGRYQRRRRDGSFEAVDAAPARVPQDATRTARDQRHRTPRDPASVPSLRSVGVPPRSHGISAILTTATLGVGSESERPRSQREDRAPAPPKSI